MGGITAARMILRNWTCPKTPERLNWWDDQNLNIQYKSILGRLHKDNEYKKSMGLFLVAC